MIELNFKNKEKKIKSCIIKSCVTTASVALHLQLCATTLKQKKKNIYWARISLSQNELFLILNISKALPVAS